jgi:AcrR family transcriptional regulator
LTWRDETPNFGSMDVDKNSAAQEPTFRPTRQKRSQAAADRMLAAGHELLETRDIDQLSIQEIAAHARSSIGSFYHRFGTKEHYFACLIQDMIETREIEANRNFNNPLADLPAALARGAIANHRKHQGLIRSAIRQHLLGKDVWLPLAQMGQRFVARYCQQIEDERQMRLEHEERQRIAFAFVWLYGMLVQSVMNLNSIYGYGIQEAEFEHETIRMFIDLMDRAVSEPARIARSD